MNIIYVLEKETHYSYALVGENQKARMIGRLAGEILGDKGIEKGIKILEESSKSGVLSKVVLNAKSRSKADDVVRMLEGAGNAIEELPAKIPQTYTTDLSGVTGKGAQVRNKAIDTMIKEDFKDLNLTYKPEYSPFIRTGIAQEGTGTQIGKNMFSSRADLRDTIIHEELHHRWWERGMYDHHPKGNDAQFYKVIERYKRMRGWN